MYSTMYINCARLNHKDDADRHSPDCICPVGVSFPHVLRRRDNKRPGRVGIDFRVCDYARIVIRYVAPHSAHLLGARIFAVMRPIRHSMCIHVHALRRALGAAELVAAKQELGYICLFTIRHISTIMTRWALRIRGFTREPPMFVFKSHTDWCGGRTVSRPRPGMYVLPYASVRISRIILYIFNPPLYDARRLLKSQNGEKLLIIFPSSAYNTQGGKKIGLHYHIRRKFSVCKLHMIFSRGEICIASSNRRRKT